MLVPSRLCSDKACKPIGDLPAGLSSEASVLEFQERVATACSIDPEKQAFKSGFPPKPLPISDRKQTITAWGLRNGDALVLECDNPNVPAPASEPAERPAEPKQPVRAAIPPVATPAHPAASTSGAARSVTNEPSSSPAIKAAPLRDGRCAFAALQVVFPTHCNSDKCTRQMDNLQSMPSSELPHLRASHALLLFCRQVVRRIVDSDNSCLFNAMGYNMERSRTVAPKLRRIVAQIVAADPFEFNEGVLGKSNEDYQMWIQNSDHWGGPIELYILAKCAVRHDCSPCVRSRKIACVSSVPGLSNTSVACDSFAMFHLQVCDVLRAAPEAVHTRNCLACGWGLVDLPIHSSTNCRLICHPTRLPCKISDLLQTHFTCLLHVRTTTCRLRRTTSAT
jgi:hypothetical protein